MNIRDMTFEELYVFWNLTDILGGLVVVVILLVILLVVRIFKSNSSGISMGYCSKWSQVETELDGVPDSSDDDQWTFPKDEELKR